MLISRLVKLVRWTKPGLPCASTCAPHGPTDTQHAAGPHRRVHARGGRSMEPSVAPGATAALQQLFEEGLLQASHVQHGTPLPGPAVQRLAALMSAVPLTELGFPANALADPAAAVAPFLQQRSPRSPLKAPMQMGAKQQDPITYLHIYEDYALGIGVFCFPEGATLPLHDHPGMTVMSRLLVGELRVKSYDWCSPAAATGKPETIQLGSIREATLVSDQIISATSSSTPMVLFPRQGNLHEFTAHAPCAVLDVLVPPYCPAAHWDCTYYQEADGNGASKPGDVTLLRAIDQPCWFSVTHGEYLGLQPKPLAAPGIPHV